MFNASLSAGKINQKNNNNLFIYLKSNMLAVFPLNKKTDLESEKLGFVENHIFAFHYWIVL